MLTWNASDIGVIKIPKADADKLPNATLPIPGEEDGYIIALEVYHQLHCLVGFLIKFMPTP